MKIVRSTMLLAIMAALVSCSSVKVFSDVDDTVDFSQFKTFSFLGWQANSDQLLNDMDRERIHNAFEKELNARGLTFVESDGDLDVSLFLVLDQKTSTTAYTNYYGGGMGGGYGAYHMNGGGWGMGYANTTYHESDYLEGTLVFDAFDGESKKQIWQGVARSTVTENREKRATNIPKKVGLLMKKFPVPEL
jgi:hypothetical protein